VRGRRGRRRGKLLDVPRERRGYSHLKEEVLDRTMWWAGFGPVVRQTAEWMNDVEMHFFCSPHPHTPYPCAHDSQCFFGHSKSQVIEHFLMNFFETLFLRQTNSWFQKVLFHFCGQKVFFYFVGVPRKSNFVLNTFADKESLKTAA